MDNAGKPCRWLLAIIFAAITLPHISLADTVHTGGIWKAAVPAHPMQGEFNNFDPLGIAAGAKIKADCSLNWISPDDGRRYCFASGTSLVYFLDQPQANIERARRGWLEMTSKRN
jgi:hypothetical protein